MQLTASNRREVIEDLLDIKIFSSMNNIFKEKTRSIKEELNVLSLKKESLNEKVKMQENFIEELENQSNKRIEDNKNKMRSLGDEICVLIIQNEDIDDKVYGLTQQQEVLTGATKKLRELGNLKGKISQKVSTITKEHKFFTENTVCPTCTQHIEEEFRINKIDDAQNKAKELQSGYKELEEAIKN